MIDLKIIIIIYFLFLLSLTFLVMKNSKVFCKLFLELKFQKNNTLQIIISEEIINIFICGIVFFFFKHICGVVKTKS